MSDDFTPIFIKNLYHDLNELHSTSSVHAEYFSIRAVQSLYLGKLVDDILHTTFSIICSLQNFDIFYNLFKSHLVKDF